MNSLLRLSLLIRFFLILSINAQETGNVLSGPDSLKLKRSYYIDNLTSKVNITPFIYAAANRFTFSGSNLKSVEFSPNEAPSIGLKMQYKWLGFGVTYGPKDIQEDKKGKSDYFNLVLNSYGKKFGFDIYYLTNKGYYIRNAQAREEIDRTKPFPQRGDLSTKGTGVNFYYLFNHKKYSYRSSFIMNEIQKKSAGSFLATFSGSYYSISADSSIVPEVYKKEISIESQIRSGQFYSLGLLPGYAFTLVAFKRLYMTLSLSYGPVYQFQRYEVTNGMNASNVDRNVWIWRGLGRFSTGYNSTYFYCGISSLGDNYSIPLGSGNRLLYTIGNIQLFAGTRLNFPARWHSASALMDRMPVLAEKQGQE